MKSRLTAVVTFEFYYNELEELYGPVPLPKSKDDKALITYIKSILKDTNIVLENDRIGSMVDAEKMDIISHCLLDIKWEKNAKETGEIKLY